MAKFGNFETSQLWHFLSDLDDLFCWNQHLLGSTVQLITPFPRVVPFHWRRDHICRIVYSGLCQPTDTGARDKVVDIIHSKAVATAWLVLLHVDILYVIAVFQTMSRQLNFECTIYMYTEQFNTLKNINLLCSIVSDGMPSNYSCHTVCCFDILCAAKSIFRVGLRNINLGYYTFSDEINWGQITFKVWFILLNVFPSNFRQLWILYIRWIHLEKSFRCKQVNLSTA